jgi:hypothetical protein
LQKLKFDYVILDESQAIKNPNSKVAKAACLLDSHHRICMSGTPLQNNTFDIYAQMNFLNPGLLGSTDFFRNEFATPIDKFGEEEQKTAPEKIVVSLYPYGVPRSKLPKTCPRKLKPFCFAKWKQSNAAFTMLSETISGTRYWARLMHHGHGKKPTDHFARADETAADMR